MSNFTKTMLVIAAGCAAFGAVLILVAGLNGGAAKASQVTWKGHYRPFNFTYGSYKSEDYSDEFLIEGEKEIDSSKIKSLSVSIGANEAKIMTSKNGKYKVEYEGTQEVKVFIDGDTLVIDASQDTPFVSTTNDRRIRIYIPENSRYETVTFDAGACSMRVDTSFDADTLVVNGGAGNVKFSGEYDVNNLSLDMGAAECKIDKINVNSANIEVGMGTFKLVGSIKGDSDINCSMGTVVLDLDGEKNSHSYDVELSAGTCSIDGEKVSGSSLSSEEINGNAPVLNIESSMGTVVVKHNGK